MLLYLYSLKRERHIQANALSNESYAALVNAYLITLLSH